jgi:hypothetical protein
VSIGAARHVLSAVFVGLDPGASQVCVESDRAAAWLPIASDAAMVLAVGRDRPSVMEALAGVSPAHAWGHAVPWGRRASFVPRSGVQI